MIKGKQNDMFWIGKHIECGNCKHDWLAAEGLVGVADIECPSCGVTIATDKDNK